MSKLLHAIKRFIFVEKPGVPPKTTQNPNLTQAIAQARQSGMSSEQILNSLTAQGWKAHEVLEVVMERIPTQKTAAEAIPTNNIISIRNITKNYGKLKALDDISLDVTPGEVTALLGPNGAGKTTLVRILTTLQLPDSGTANIAGLNVVEDAQELRSVIGLAGQNAAVDESLTGRENLDMVGRLYHMSKAMAKLRTDELLKEFELEDAADRTVKTYSGGMRRRLDLAASLVIRPKILFLDEPTTGLDPSSRFALWQTIRELVASGTTVLLTTQYLEEADQLANHIFVIDHGKIIAQGTPDELKQQVGGEIVELHLKDRATATQAAGLISPFGVGPAKTDITAGVVTMPVTGGTATLLEIIREIDTAGLDLVDVILRRPSLDDVFMKLTGHEAEIK